MISVQRESKQQEDVFIDSKLSTSSITTAEKEKWGGKYIAK